MQKRHFPQPPEALYSQVDEEGKTYAVLSGIVDHRKDGSAVALDDSINAGDSESDSYNKGLAVAGGVEGWDIRLVTIS